MRLSSPLRGVAVILAVIAAAVIYGRLSGASDDADGAAGSRPAAARDLLLRLHDLPPGYVNYSGPREGDDAEEPLCSRLTKPADTPAALASVIKRFHPGGCLATYAQIYTVPGIVSPAPIVATGAMRLQSGVAADAVWKVLPTMLGRLSGDIHPHRARTKPATIGQETVLLHAPVPPFPLNYFGKKASYEGLAKLASPVVLRVGEVGCIGDTSLSSGGYPKAACRQRCCWRTSRGSKLGAASQKWLAWREAAPSGRHQEATRTLQALSAVADRGVVRSSVYRPAFSPGRAVQLLAWRRPYQNGITKNRKQVEA